jgi:hypothetical protein
MLDPNFVLDDEGRDRLIARFGAGAAGYNSGELPTLAQGMESMFSRIGGLLSDPRVSPLVSPQALADGHRKARVLASDGPAGLLHGDLHLSNILRAGPDQEAGRLLPPVPYRSGMKKRRSPGRT